MWLDFTLSLCNGQFPNLMSELTQYTFMSAKVIEKSLYLIWRGFQEIFLCFQQIVQNKTKAAETSFLEI